MNQSENRVIVSEQIIYRRYLVPKGFDAKRLIEESRVYELEKDGELVIENKEGGVLMIKPHYDSSGGECLKCHDADFEDQEAEVAECDKWFEEFTKVEPLERWSEERYTLGTESDFFRTDEEIEKGVDPYAEEKKKKAETLRQTKIINHERLIQGYKKILQGYPLLTPELKKLTEEAIASVEEAIKNM